MQTNNTSNLSEEIIAILFKIRDNDFTLKNGEYGHYIDLKTHKIYIKASKDTKFNKYYAYILKGHSISLSIKELNEYSIIDSANYLIKKYNLK